MKRTFVVFGAAFVVAVAFTLVISHAQETAISVQSPTPDSIVQLTADQMGLPLLSPDQVPPAGTFWWVEPGGAAAPAPCPPPDLMSAPIYQMANGQFLVDETGGQVVVNMGRFGSQAQNTSSAVASALAAQSDALAGLITQIQTTAANQQAIATAQAMGMNVSSLADVDSGGGGANFSTYALDTSQLWLQITNVSAAAVSANLYNANDQVYAIWSTTNLATPFANWQVETEVWPTNTTVMPFAVLTQGRQNLFMCAEDWTGVTENGNQTPDWWFWEYFRTTALSDSDLDSQGNSLLSDYQNRSDPNAINFSLVVTNNYVNTPAPPVELNLMAGWPAYCAVSVDDTNYAADANWQTYTGTNITVPLGSAAGWHSVWVGLKGPAPDAAVTWQWDRLNLDVPPVLVLTNPASSTVTVPVIQLQGYCQEPLAGISYDLANAAGTVTGQQVLVMDQFYDTNYWVFTTNTFQAFDVPLTNGLNVITLHATDLAGNTTTASYNFTLDYSNKTNPPQVQVNWPQDGVEICGSSFTCQGTVSDPTATVTVQIVDTNNDTNVVTAAVGRDGDFWAQGLPLSSGPNYLTLTAMDVVGNVTTINLTVVQGNLGLAIDPASAGQTTVTGEINDSGDYTIWVNGVQATENGNNTWTAQIAAIGVGGGVVEAMAIPNSDKGGYGSGILDPAGNPLGSATFAQSDGAFSAQDDPSQPQSLQADQDVVQSAQGPYISMYKDDQQFSYSAYWSGMYWEQPPTEYDNVKWHDVSGGTEDWLYFESDENEQFGITSYAIAETDITWPGTTWPQSLPPGSGLETTWGYSDVSPPSAFSTSPASSGVPRQAMLSCHIKGQGTICLGFYEYYQRQADCQVKLATGGSQGSTAMSLWVITVSAKAYYPPWLAPQPDGVPEYMDPTLSPWLPSSSAPIDSSRITINGKQAGSDGVVYLTLQDNADPDITPIISGAPQYYTFSISAQKYTLSISANGNNLSATTPTFCVGQSITFTPLWSPSTPPYINSVQHWTLPDKYVNQQTNYSPSCITYVRNDNYLTNPSQQCWYVNGSGGTVSVGMNLQLANGQCAGASAKGIFSIFRPQLIGYNMCDFRGVTVPITSPCLYVTNVGNMISLGDANGGYARFWASYQAKPGDLFFETQIVQSYRKWGYSPPVDSGSDWWFDGSWIKPGSVSPAGADGIGVVQQTDQYPAIPLEAPESKVNDIFRTYFQYQPAGGGILITLGSISWSWYEDATYNGSYWNIPPGTVSDPKYNSDDSFPLWNGTHP